MHNHDTARNRRIADWRIHRSSTFRIRRWNRSRRCQRTNASRIFNEPGARSCWSNNSARPLSTDQRPQFQLARDFPRELVGIAFARCRPAVPGKWLETTLPAFTLLSNISLRLPTSQFDPTFILIRIVGGMVVSANLPSAWTHYRES
jgi:hypothetical protein